MGKRKQQQPKKGKKKAQLAKLGSDQQAQVDDVMAWGRKRQNYYRQDEDEYSELSEQERQAQQIYQNRYENYLNDEGLYDIPEGNVQEQKEARQVQGDLDQDEQALPEEYIRQELEWVLELFKDLEFYEENELLKVYEKLLKSYLTLIVSIKELKIPYIQYHPIVPLAVDVKGKIAKLMKKLTVRQDEEQEQANVSKKQAKNFQIEEEQSEGDIQGQDFDEEDGFGEEGEQMDQFDEDQMEDEDLGQQDWSQSEQKPSKALKSTKLAPYPNHCTQAGKTQKQQHKKGLQYYEKMKQSLQEQKKAKKLQKRQQRLENKKPAFKQTNENQGRFASQLILKNKGLMKKRKKIQGNSRVKLRKKYQKKKAIHRARSGHFVRENPGRAYQGQSNIRTGKIAGVRLK